LRRRFPQDFAHIALVGLNISRMPGPPFGPSANHHHITRLHLTAQNSLRSVFFRFEDSCPAFETQAFLARYFCDGALRCELPYKTTKWLSSVVGAEWPHGGLAVRIRGHIPPVLPERCYRYREAIAVQQFGVSRGRRILQGVKLLQVEATPTWGFSTSSSPKSSTRSMERLGFLLDAVGQGA
jgi:hypothetical protein